MRKLAIFLVLLVVSISKADIREFLDNSVILIENNSATLQTDTHSVYFGGGYKLKTPSTTFQSLTVIPPSFKAGCGGIDLTFGAFSYFNVEYLVSFLKAVAAQAPAFAFKTAIQTLCPQCDQQMNNLTALANAINGLNFNSCQTAQLIGGKVGSWLGRNLNRTLDVGSSGPDWLKSFNENMGQVAKFVNNDVKNWFISQGCNPDDRTCYASFIYSNKISLLEYLVQDIPYIGDSEGFQNILRSLIGDIIKRSASDEDRIKTIYLPPTLVGDVVEDVVDGIATGDGVCDNMWTFDNAIDRYGKTTSASVPTLCFYVNNNLSTIIEKIKNREALSSSELEFLSMFKTPVYQLLNTLSFQPDALDGAKKELVEYLTYQLTYDVLSAILSNYSALLLRQKNASDDEAVPLKSEDIKWIQRNISNVLRRAFAQVVDKQEKFWEIMDKNFKVKRLRSMLMANLSRHPIMDSRLYSKALLGF